MSATNHTSNLGLPQYIGTDKPTYLGDWNDTMGLIDQFAGEVETQFAESGSEMTEIRDSIGHLQSEVTLQESTLSVLNTRLAACELKDTQQDTNIAKLDTDVAALAPLVDGMDERLSDVESQVQLNTQNIVSVRSDIDDIAGDDIYLTMHISMRFTSTGTISFMYSNSSFTFDNKYFDPSLHMLQLVDQYVLGSAERMQSVNSTGTDLLIAGVGATGICKQIIEKAVTLINAGVSGATDSISVSGTELFYGLDSSHTVKFASSSVTGTIPLTYSYNSDTGRHTVSFSLLTELAGSPSPYNTFGYDVDSEGYWMEKYRVVPKTL